MHFYQNRDICPATNMLLTNPRFSAYMEQLSARGQVFTRSFQPGALLLRQDAQALQAFVIQEGIAKCYMRENNGKDYIFEFLGKGEITGELELIGGQRCICSIEAITEVTAWVTPADVFAGLLHTDMEFNRLVMGELATRLTQTCVRASYQQAYPLEYGLLRFLMLQQEAQLFFSSADIAAYLGITVRSFNRTVKQLREKKVIAVDGLHLDLTRKELDLLLKRFED
ncbi:Crp/Fnr family transcriptional regulator [Chitinophaga horti]|uniref:Crp/Fnr family transcriptional regulator n=1 Tax=Chitinophaga horti TaxID=2920382 RepID=A0ABY6J3Z8_9BACT|nr:Crp/Fnr family transcriptional regulator [Chitinophaga horti]UYQ94347.1 Crp/Fnr family transcriptional regulator [Chitinophaga horti]